MIKDPEFVALQRWVVRSMLLASAALVCAYLAVTVAILHRPQDRSVVLVRTDEVSPCDATTTLCSQSGRPGQHRIYRLETVSGQFLRVTISLHE